MDDEHKRRLAEAKNQIADAINPGDLSDAKKQRYTEAARKVLEAMTPVALARHATNTKGYRFYASHKELTDAFLAKYPAAQGQVKLLKGVFDRDGVLHLNSDGMLFGRQAPLTEFYAHEVAHTIDGNAHEISSTEEWRKAWKDEIDFFMGAGHDSPIEGFAEFGQMLLGDPQITRQHLRQAMPKCLPAWEGKGL